MHPDCKHEEQTGHFCFKCAATRDTLESPWRALTEEESAEQDLREALKELEGE